MNVYAAILSSCAVTRKEKKVIKQGLFCLLFSVDVKPKNAQCLYTEKAGPHFANMVAK